MEDYDRVALEQSVLWKLFRNFVEESILPEGVSGKIKKILEAKVDEHK